MNRLSRVRWAVLLSVLLVVCLVLLLVVAGQVARAYVEMRHLQETHAGVPVEVRPWMTIPYIAHTYQVPEEELYRALGLAPTVRHRKAPLEVIARREGRNLDADIATLNAVVKAHQAPEPPPGPPAPSPPPTP